MFLHCSGVSPYTNSRVFQAEVNETRRRQKAEVEQFEDEAQNWGVSGIPEIGQ